MELIKRVLLETDPPSGALPIDHDGSESSGLESKLVFDPTSTRPSLAVGSRASEIAHPAMGGTEPIPAGSSVGRRLHLFHRDSLAIHASLALPWRFLGASLVLPA